MSNNKNTFILNNNVLEVLDIVRRHDFVHIREISRLAGVSPTTASMILKELEGKGILKRKVLGKNCFYSMNRNSQAKRLTAIVEDYGFLKACNDKGFSSMAEAVMANTAEIRNFVDCIMAYDDNGPAILFVTSLDPDTIRSRLNGIDAGKITVLTRENIRNNLDSELIKKIISRHTIIYGTERFMELVY